MTSGWNTFGFKAFTMEEAPDINVAKGFMDRCFVFHCVSGSPQYDIKEVTNPAGDDEYVDLLKELEDNRKILFAYRLLHYHDPIPNIDLSVKNREKQLCKPVLRLFQDSQCQKQIGEALADLIGQKRGLKRGTLEAKVLDVIDAIIANREKVKEQQKMQTAEEDKGQWILSPWEPNEIPNSELFESVRVGLEGEYKRDKDKSFETDEHGIVSHDKIRRLCHDKFGAEPRQSNGIRYLKFNLDKLNKAKAAYQFPDKVIILQKKTKKEQREGDSSKTNDDKKDSESGRAQKAMFGPFLGYTEENKKDTDVKTSEDDSKNSANEAEKMKEIDKMGGSGAGENDKNSDAYPQNDQNSAFSALQDSSTFLQSNNIEEQEDKRPPSSE